MKRIVPAVLALLLTAVARPVVAQSEHPIQLSLFPPVQIVPEDEAVRGFRLGLYAKNTSMTGLDIGAVSHTTRSFLGVQFSLVGLAEGDFVGAQLDVVNIVVGSFEGVQLGPFSSARDGRGAQISWVNHAQSFRGLQLAFFNYTETMNGVQIGLINVIRRGGVLPVMPFVNWSLEESPMD